MSVQIQQRRDTSANWVANNPVLAEGEMAIELDSRNIKFGNGVDPYLLLPYFNGESVIFDNLPQLP